MTAATTTAESTTTTEPSTVVGDTAPKEDGSKRKRESVPAEGYKCKICGEGGHWIQQCPSKKSKKKKKNSSHVYVEGIDPSQTDIEKAKEMQKLKPPPCYCGVTSRVKKVKQSKYNPTSRAIGLYFFFCANKKDDGTACRFAKPVDEDSNTTGGNSSSSRHKSNNDSYKQRQQSRQPPAETGPAKRLCMFYAKNKSCKKGDECMFSHELPAVTKFS